MGSDQGDGEHAYCIFSLTFWDAPNVFDNQRHRTLDFSGHSSSFTTPKDWVCTLIYLILALESLRSSYITWRVRRGQKEIYLRSEKRGHHVRKCWYIFVWAITFVYGRKKLRWVIASVGFTVHKVTVVFFNLTPFCHPYTSVEILSPKYRNYIVVLLTRQSCKHAILDLHVCFVHSL